MSKSYRKIKDELAKTKEELRGFASAYEEVCGERDKFSALWKKKRKELSDALVHIKVLEHTEQHLKSAERALIEKDELIEELQGQLDELQCLRPKKEVEDNVKKIARGLNRKRNHTSIEVTVVKGPKTIREVFDGFIDELNHIL